MDTTRRTNSGVMWAFRKRRPIEQNYRYHVYDALITVMALIIFATVFTTLSHNLARLHINSGFSFLQAKQAGFGISETLIEYDSQSNYGRAVLVGLLNTLLVSVLAIFFSTVFGTLLGAMRMSANRLASRIAYLYVEIFRNTPLLLQLMFWYSLMLITFPTPKLARPSLGFALLTNRGLFLPRPISEQGFSWFFSAVAVSLVAATIWRVFAAMRQRSTGDQLPVFWPSIIFFCLAILAGKLIAGAEVSLEWPRVTGFRVAGGFSLSPELGALLGGLTFYTTALISEIVRSGVISVERGQIEAARALGLHEGQILRLITLPLAIRVVIPPLISQYLSLAKNSSLAVAIGYPDIASITNTIINQTGQAIEGVAILMGSYLTLSLTISLVMNYVNARLALVRR